MSRDFFWRMDAMAHNNRGLRRLAEERERENMSAKLSDYLYYAARNGFTVAEVDGDRAKELEKRVRELELNTEHMAVCAAETLAAEELAKNAKLEAEVARRHRALCLLADRIAATMTTKSHVDEVAAKVLDAALAAAEHETKEETSCEK